MIGRTVASSTGGQRLATAAAGLAPAGFPGKADCGPGFATPEAMV